MQISIESIKKIYYFYAERIEKTPSGPLFAIIRVLTCSKFGLFYSNFLILIPTFSKLPTEKYGKTTFFSGKQHFYSYFQNPSESFMMPNSDPRDSFICSTLTLMLDSYLKKNTLKSVPGGVQLTVLQGFKSILSISMSAG